MHRISRGPALAVLIAVALVVPGARPAAGDGPLRFARLTVDDGLPQSSVMRILQDRLGFLWFATEEGLCRYDGHRFVTHRAGDAPWMLANSNIAALIEDHAGDLWVGTSLGLHRLDIATGRFTREGGPAAALVDVADVVEDASGRIWFSGFDSGLYVLERPTTGSGLARQVSASTLAAGAEVTALVAVGSTLWATSDGCLLRIEANGSGDANMPRVSRERCELGAVAVLAAQRDGRLWIGRRGAELLRYSPATGSLETFPRAPRDVLALLPAADGALWIGARDGGLSRLEPETGNVTTERNDPGDLSSLSENDVAALYEDRTGNLWIGTWNGGVNMLDPYAQAFRSFEHRPYDAGSLPDNDVMSMTETPDGRIWMGSRNAVLAVGDPRTGRFRSVAPALAPRGRVRALAHDGNELFVATAHGLAFLDARSARETPPSPAVRRSGLDTRPVASLAVGPQGDLLVAASDGAYLVPKAARAADAQAPVRQLTPALPQGVSAIHAPASGRLWVAASDGRLLVQDPASPAGTGDDLRPFPLSRAAAGETAPAESGRYITSLLEDSHGRLWVGTREGLAAVTVATGVTRWFNRSAALPSVIVAGILEDAEGFIWYANNRGLARVDPRSGATLQFGSRDGAQGSGYAEGAYTRGGSGLLYFAGHGLTVFDPRQIAINPNPPTVAFTGLEIGHRPAVPRWLDPNSPLERELHSQETMTLGSDATVLTFEMAALHFGDPKRNAFAYRLEGFDGDWVHTDAERAIATYTRLAPGDYLLRARAVTSHGVWSVKDATLAIHVLPPWWRTWPALVAWSLLAAFGVTGLWLAARRRAQTRLALLEREAFRRASLTDPLTGLYNRRFIGAHLEHELPKVLRGYDLDDRAAGDLLFFLIDVDRFKTINDRFSHAAGDQVLIDVAHALRSEVRDSDLAIRWGGDEFLVVSRSFNRRFAGLAAERLRHAVGSLTLRVGDEELRCSLSIGYAAFPFLPHARRALTWEQTLELADRALLLTKRRRRDGHTGLLAGTDVDAATVLAFLAGGPEAPVPPGIEVRSEDAE